MTYKDIYKIMGMEHQIWKHLICPNSSLCFRLGDEVFLKSNPSLCLIVCGYEDKDVVCTWDNGNGMEQICTISPKDLLHYAYACLMVSDDGKFVICLN